MELKKICHDDGKTVTLTADALLCTAAPLVTCSQRLREQLSVLESVAPTHLPVLISGEPGTQKQLYAEYLHRHSGRAEGRYVRFDCAATHVTQLESTLFGRDGSSAAFCKKGLAEAAQGGTLLLDGISALPTGFYEKLERFLDTGTIRPQGSRSARPVDVRVVSICGQTVTSFVKREPGAAALVQKLAAVRIDVPPLRQRPEDIALLSLHALETANRRYGVQKRMGSTLFRGLLEYGWPGNERELQSFIEQLVLVSKEEVLNDPSALRATAGLSAALTPGLGQQEAPAEPSLREMVSAYERMLIHQSIRKHGSLRKAAKALQVAPSALSRKLAAEKEELL